MNVLTSLAVTVLVAAACGAGQKVDEQKSSNRLAIGEDFLRQGQLEAAVGEAKEALKYAPSNSKAYNLLGLIDVNRAVQMQMIIEVEDCLSGVDAESLLGKRDQHLLAARDSFRKAATFAHDYGEAYHGAATVDLLLDDYESAREQFSRALQFPAQLESVPLSRAGLGWAYYLLGRYAEAATELRQALRFAPSMCLAQYRLGRVYFSRKEWDKALSAFEKVVAQSKECPIQEAHLYLMKTYAKKGLVASLPGLLERCLALAPKSCVADECRALVP
jgi:type IV pilus assembly protein PilF